jgi:hypothetical protein
MEPVERARIRQELLEATRAAEQRPAHRLPLLAGVLAALMLAAGLGILSRLGSSRPDEGPGNRGALPERAAVRVPPRQVQIATPGGTRVVWILNPDFEL